MIDTLCVGSFEMGDDIRTTALTLWNEHIADIAKRANIAKSRAIYLALRDPLGRRLGALAKSADHLVVSNKASPGDR